MPEGERRPQGWKVGSLWRLGRVEDRRRPVLGMVALRLWIPTTEIVVPTRLGSKGQGLLGDELACSHAPKLPPFCSCRQAWRRWRTFGLRGGRLSGRDVGGGSPVGRSYGSDSGRGFGWGYGGVCGGGACRVD